MSKKTDIPKLEPGQSIDLDIDLIDEHPLLKTLPPIEKNDPDVLNISDSIATVGIIHPLIVSPKGELMDGRRRYRAAKRQQLAKVPVRVVSEDNAALLIMAALKDRAHMNKGQIAFMMVPMLEPSFKIAWQKRMANLGQKTVETDSVGFGESPELPKPLEEWARELKMCVDTLQQAYRIHRHFQDKTKRDLTDDEDITEKATTFEQFYRKRMFRENKPYSLKGVLAGIGYQLDREANEKKGNNKKDAGGRPAKLEKKLGKFQETFKTFNTRLGYWEKFDDDTKEEALEPLDKSLEKIPDDLLETMAKKFSAELRRRKAEKEGK